MAKKCTNRTPKKRSAPNWESRFLARLAQTANIRNSAAAAGVARQTVYDRRAADPDFSASMDAAIDDAVDLLELEARRRACDGLQRVKFHQGQPIMVPIPGTDGKPVFDASGSMVVTPYVEHEYSDTLMIFLLKAHRPEKYRERYQVEHAGSIDVQLAETVVRTREEAARAVSDLAEASRVP